MLKTILKLYCCALLSLSLSPAVFAADDLPAGNGSEHCEPCRQFNKLNTLIRDRKIATAEAKLQLLALLPAIKEYALQQGAQRYTRSQWVFPVAGLNTETAGNRRGADYVASGYDYFAGNAHGGHPSFDLFIHDRNQDSLDDRTGKPAKVLSLTGGIVVAAENEWAPGSRLRGGKYLWIYDVSAEALVYYAHNLDLLVTTGAIVKPGDPIATIGRTGMNAYKKRSPTHLHLTFLKITDGQPEPENIFPDLKRANISRSKLSP